MKNKVLYLLEKQGHFAIREIDIPKPPPGHVLVEVQSIALNPIDWKIAKLGWAVEPEHYPAILGQDVAGIVKEVGEGVTRFRVGDKV